MANISRRQSAKVCFSGFGGCIIYIFICLLYCSNAFCASAQNGAAAAEDKGLYKEIAASVQSALDAEKQELDKLDQKLAKAVESSQIGETRIQAYNLQASTHNNLLLLPKVSVNDLTQAYNEQLLARSRLKDHQEEIRQTLDEIDALKQKTAAQLKNYEQQLAELKPREISSPILAGVKKQLTELTGILNEKKRLLEEISTLYQTQSDQIRQTREEIGTISEKTVKKISEAKKSRLYDHQKSPLTAIFDLQEWQPMMQLPADASALFSAAYWEKFEIDWPSYCLFAGGFILLLLMSEILMITAGRLMRRPLRWSRETGNFGQFFTLKLIQRSLPFAGALLFLSFYPVRPEYRMTPFFAALPIAVRLLAIMTVVEWGLVLFRTIRRMDVDPFLIRVARCAPFFFWPVLIYGIGHVLISHLVCTDCAVMVSWRLVFEIGLVVWSALFLRMFRRRSVASPLMNTAWFPSIRLPLIICGYLIPGAALLFELSGFGGFADYWLVSFGKSAAVLLWGVLLFFVLREIKAALAVPETDPEEAEDDDAADRPYPIRLTVVHLAQMLLGASFLVGLPLMWGAEKTYLADLFYALNYKVAVGGIEFNVMGFVYAMIVLLFIRPLALIGKYVLANRILADSKIEWGVKDSFGRIIGYFIWMIGILLALRLVGIGATSMAVVFGAVGIGLGFGLQTIFNNFVSGIIILFERPIKVGDVIEMDGIWGTVKDIRVRSTVVRTYNNSDLIVPNSEFVSQKLTNWSFRDAKVRRSITVGVAYGSDTGLVRETLYAIAFKQTRVFRRPKPEVLFIDFGDSALMFKLRFWTDIDHMLTVETDIRFEIERQFAELNIKIPFPQRDIHVIGGGKNAGNVEDEIYEPDERQAVSETP